MQNRYVNLVRTLRNWPSYLSYKYGFSRPDTLHFLTRGGVSVSVPKKVLSEFKEIFMSQAYVKHFEKRSFPKRPVVIDIGANVGFFSLFIASWLDHPRIFAFEPIPANFNYLNKQQESNLYLNLTCFQQAVTATPGKLRLNIQNPDVITTSATLLSRDGHTNSIEVETTSLEEIFSRQNLDACDLLKLDCEGAEFEILYHCPETILQRIQHLSIEVHQGEGTDQNAAALANFLRGKGFRVKQEGIGPLSMLWGFRN